MVSPLRRRRTDSQAIQKALAISGRGSSLYDKPPPLAQASEDSSSTTPTSSSSNSDNGNISSFRSSSTRSIRKVKELRQNRKERSATPSSSKSGYRPAPNNKKLSAGGSLRKIVADHVVPSDLGTGRESPTPSLLSKKNRSKGGSSRTLGSTRSLGGVGSSRHVASSTRSLNPGILMSGKGMSKTPPMAPSRGRSMRVSSTTTLDPNPRDRPSTSPRHKMSSRNRGGRRGASPSKPRRSIRSMSPSGRRLRRESSPAPSRGKKKPQSTPPLMTSNSSSSTNSSSSKPKKFSLFSRYNKLRSPEALQEEYGTTVSFFDESNDKLQQQAQDPTPGQLPSNDELFTNDPTWSIEEAFANESPPKVMHQPSKLGSRSKSPTTSRNTIIALSPKSPDSASSNDQEEFEDMTTPTITHLRNSLGSDAKLPSINEQSGLVSKTKATTTPPMSASSPALSTGSTLSMSLAQMAVSSVLLGKNEDYDEIMTNEIMTFDSLENSSKSQSKDSTDEEMPANNATTPNNMHAEKVERVTNLRQRVEISYSSEVKNKTQLFSGSGKDDGSNSTGSNPTSILHTSPLGASPAKFNQAKNVPAQTIPLIVTTPTSVKETGSATKATNLEQQNSTSPQIRVVRPHKSPVNKKEEKNNVFSSDGFSDMSSLEAQFNSLQVETDPNDIWNSTSAIESWTVSNGEKVQLPPTPVSWSDHGSLSRVKSPAKSNDFEGAFQTKDAEAEAMAFFENDEKCNSDGVLPSDDIVFGDPATFGAAGGEAPSQSPTVRSRAAAVEGWTTQRSPTSSISPCKKSAHSPGSPFPMNFDTTPQKNDDPFSLQMASGNSTPAGFASPNDLFNNNDDAWSFASTPNAMTPKQTDNGRATVSSPWSMDNDDPTDPFANETDFGNETDFKIEVKGSKVVDWPEDDPISSDQGNFQFPPIKNNTNFIDNLERASKTPAPQKGQFPVFPSPKVSQPNTNPRSPSNDNGKGAWDGFVSDEEKFAGFGDDSLFDNEKEGIPLGTSPNALESWNGSGLPWAKDTDETAEPHMNFATSKFDDGDNNNGFNFGRSADEFATFGSPTDPEWGTTSLAADGADFFSP